MPNILDPSRYGIQQDEEDDQLTDLEREQLAELGMYDERQAKNARQMARASKLRESIQGGSKGTYGRWGQPTPYNPWGDVARELGATIGERRAEKAAKEESDKAKEALKMYERRQRQPYDTGVGMGRTQQAVEDDLLATPMPDLGEFEKPGIADRLRAWGSGMKSRFF